MQRFVLSFIIIIYLLPYVFRLSTPVCYKTLIRRVGASRGKRDGQISVLVSLSTSSNNILLIRNSLTLYRQRDIGSRNAGKRLRFCNVKTASTQQKTKGCQKCQIVVTKDQAVTSLQHVTCCCRIIRFLFSVCVFFRIIFWFLPPSPSRSLLLLSLTQKLQSFLYHLVIL